MRKVKSLMSICLLLVMISTNVLAVSEGLRPAAVYEVDGTTVRVEGKNFVQESAEDILYYFDDEECDWRYSISFNKADPDKILLCMIDKREESAVYQMTLDSEDIDVSARSLAGNEMNHEAILEKGLMGLESAQKVEFSVEDLGAQVRSSDLNKFISDMTAIHGSPYVNVVKYGTTYNGKTFQVKETKDIGGTAGGSKVFRAFITIGGIVTAFAEPTITIQFIAKVLALEGLAETVVSFSTNFQRYSGAVTFNRDTYTSGVSYHINHTSMAYGYIGLSEKNTAKELQTTSDGVDYQHSADYFNNYSYQVQDAYRNYFG